MASLKFRVVLCRIRLFPTLFAKIKWLEYELPLITCTYSLVQFKWLFRWRFTLYSKTIRSEARTPQTENKIPLNTQSNSVSQPTNCTCWIIHWIGSHVWSYLKFNARYCNYLMRFMPIECAFELWTSNTLHWIHFEQIFESE